jgi:hypothetical protein
VCWQKALDCRDLLAPLLRDPRSCCSDWSLGGRQDNRAALLKHERMPERLPDREVRGESSLGALTKREVCMDGARAAGDPRRHEPAKKEFTGLKTVTKNCPALRLVCVSKGVTVTVAAAEREVLCLPARRVC